MRSFCSGNSKNDVYPSGNYMLKDSNRNTIIRCKICSKLTPCLSASVVNFKQVNAS